MVPLAAPASDEIPEVLATGRTDVTTFYVSMSARHPQGRDADYLEWHCFDHRPEQYRLAALRSSLRIVSTPACRAARAASHARYDAVDHVMSYFFADLAALDPFVALGAALANAGRTPYLLPAVERSVYRLAGKKAAPRIKVGADVLPWWPARGVYLLVEQGEEPASNLALIPGVAGAWWGTGIATKDAYATAENSGLQITYCYLDADPVDAAQCLRPVLEKRWSQGGVVPLLAAPFHTVVPHDLGRYLP
jgi:hypothetical protein